MGMDAFLSALWRRRLLFVLTFALSVAAVVAITLSLPKTYQATATLFVGTEPGVDVTAAFDTTLGEQLVRTYTTLASNPNVADDVRRRVPGGLSRAALLGRMSFAPIERTRLLEITAQDSTPAAAQALANTYADVFVTRANNQVKRNQAPALLAVNEKAAQPTGPAKPNPPLYIGLGAILAAFLATGLALLRDRIEDRLAVAPDEDELFGLPVIARIPDVPPTRMDASSEFRDAFSVLKANVDFMGEEPPRVLLVTSPAPAEGKSTIATNLAHAAAADGEKVALIETDLRRPGLAKVLRGSSGAAPGAGLSDYLLGTAEIGDVVTTDPSRPNLSVVWGGSPTANPSALLHSARFSALVLRLVADHDRIIIDSPPISVGADASVAVRVVDAALFVLSAESSRRSVAQAGLNQLLVARAPRIGIVLNRAKVSRSTRYGYYHDDVAADPRVVGPGDASAGREPRATA